jgi:shikimate kinase
MSDLMRSTLEHRANSAPYRNLVLAGTMGVGKRQVAEAIAERFAAPLRDIDAEIEVEAGMPPRQVRELFGEARLTSLETEICRELALQRSAVVSVSATVMLNEANRERLQETGVILVLTTALNETLRRLHAAHGDAFHTEKSHAIELARLKREWKIRDLPGLAHLDTTLLTPEQVTAEAIAFWQSEPEY